MGFQNQVRERDRPLEKKDCLYGGVESAIVQGIELKDAWACMLREPQTCDFEVDTVYRTIRKCTWYYFDVWNDHEYVVHEGNYYHHYCVCCGSPVKYDRSCLSF